MSVIVINSVICGFSRVNLVWLAASTVRLQVSDYSRITQSDYNSTEWLVKHKAANAPITFAEIVMIMINMIMDLVLKHHLKTTLVAHYYAKI